MYANRAETMFWASLRVMLLALRERRQS